MRIWDEQKLWLWLRKDELNLAMKPYQNVKTRPQLPSKAPGGTADDGKVIRAEVAPSCPAVAASL